MSTFKKIITNTRVIILMLFILFAVVAIHPSLNDNGVTIRTISKDSIAEYAGFQAPSPNAKPMSREVIQSINGKVIEDVDAYYEFINNLEINKTLIFKTNKKTYTLKTQEDCYDNLLDEFETIEQTKEILDNETNELINITEKVEVQKKETICTGNLKDLGIGVYEAPTTNIRKGLDLEGGTRVVLAPEEEINAQEADMVIENIKQRLNVYGLSDIVVRSISDFDGSQYILVEVPGANQEEVRQLLSQQGKFEALVGDKVVFKGGNDIVYICNEAECSGIDVYSGGCGMISGTDTWSCRFRFQISLSSEAAQRQWETIKDLDIIYSENSQEGYLSENLSLLLDDELFSELRIGAGLQAKPETEIIISGSGQGNSKQAATEDALSEMKKLQVVLKTGSLPVKLNIVQSSAISPSLGEEFIDNALLIGVLALLVVVIIVIARYKKMFIAVPMVVAMVSEIIILLGFASLVGWRLDLAAIAGVIIAVGTGVDDQIVIVDETMGKKKYKEYLSWVDKLKRAFFIIMTAYFTTVVAMIPLMGSGAGLLKGFALTTIVGVSIGVFITRPAFASMMEILSNKFSKDED
ncbi:MAG: hypothetical protein AB7V77_04005 [Candidatus Woesearchaeota archaeon]